MNERAKVDAYGAVSEPSTLTIQRMLPGPIERVWAYLTESDLRRKWLSGPAGAELTERIGPTSSNRSGHPRRILA